MRGFLARFRAEQQQKAIELARGVDGVKQVICRLEIQGKSDELVMPATDVPAADVPANVETTVQLASTGAQPATGEAPMPPIPPAPVVGSGSRPAPLPQLARRPRVRQMPRPVTRQQAAAIRTAGRQGRPMPASYCSPGQFGGGGGYGGGGGGMPQGSGYVPGGGSGGAGGAVSYDNANMPGYAWPSYAAHPNYAALTYPKQYSPTAWPYIGPFYPYPQVPLGWRKVCLEWDDGWWMLDFSHCKTQ